MKSFSVIWTEQAIESLHEIHDFIRINSPQRCLQLVTDLVTIGNSLSTLPYRFPMEPLLANEPFAYRFATHTTYKLLTLTIN